MKKPLELPEKFVMRMKETLGGDFENFASALEEDPPISVRKNMAKPTEAFDDCAIVPWCPEGRYLPQRPPFVEDPFIFAGNYYVQEASSMFLSEVMRQHAPLDSPLNVLDLCAAPGGKSTLLASLLNKKSFLISNEIVSKRVAPLVENLVRWGLPNVLITNNNPQQFEALPEFFDVIVVDAPCSGEGMFRKDQKAVQQWSEHLVATCAIRQKNILESAVKCLKPGGLLIYSTCTFAPLENEGNLAWLAENGGFTFKKMALGDDWGIEEGTVVAGEHPPIFGYRFLPNRLRGEGFFMACLQKEQTGYHTKKIKINRKSPKVEKIPQKFHGQFTSWLSDPEQFDFVLDGEQVYALPAAISPNYPLLHSHLRIRLAGLALGKFKNKKFIPGHELAASTALDDSVPTLHLDYEAAMQYLRRLDMDVDTESLSGWAVVKYKNQALGWVKVLPNRINNYYPMELRIRKDLDM